MALHVETPLPRFRCEGFAYDRVSDTLSGGAIIRRIGFCRQLLGGSRAGRGFRLGRIRFCPIEVQRRVITSCSSSTVNAIAGPGSSLGDHILGCVSCFLVSRGRALMGRISPSHADALDWLPPKLQEELLRSEAFTVALVREGLVFGTLGLMHGQVHNLCRRLFRIASAAREVPLPGGGAEYKTSVFHAAAAPLRLLIIIWASVRMLRVISVSAQLQQFIGSDVFGKASAIGIVVSSCWFFIRWKHYYIDNLISQHKTDKPHMLAFDRLVSLFLYFLAAMSIADIMGLQLRSLLAVGGVSGLAVGLAAKELVSNFIGGALIFLARPFVIGESIEAGAVSGSVQDIGYLQTKVLSFDNVPLLVPNSTFVNQVITNFSRANSKHMDASFYLHNQDIFLVNKITADVKTYLKSHPQVTETNRSTPMCYLNKMGHWGPEICIVCNVGSGVTYYEVRQEIMVEVAKIIVDVLGEEAPYFRNSVTNLMWELRMHLLYAGQSDQH